MSSSTRATVIISVLLATGSFVSFGGLLYLIETQSKATSIGQFQYQEALAGTQKADSIAAAVQNTSRERVELDRYFIGRENVVEFLEEIESFGIQTGASVEVTSVELESLNESVEELKLVILTSGSWTSLVHLLLLLDSAPLLIEFDRISFESGSEGEWSGFFDIRVAKLK